ncbi:hypothetical protein P7K49_010008, partial [Saguinus oedipus]
WWNEVTCLTILQGCPAASTGMRPDALLRSPGMHLLEAAPASDGGRGAIRPSVSARRSCSALICRWPFGG